jgi:hypothetical protein
MYDFALHLGRGCPFVPSRRTFLEYSISLPTDAFSPTETDDSNTRAILTNSCFDFVQQ